MAYAPNLADVADQVAADLSIRTHRRWVSDPDKVDPPCGLITVSSIETYLDSLSYSVEWNGYLIVGIKDCHDTMRDIGVQLSVMLGVGIADEMRVVTVDLPSHDAQFTALQFTFTTEVTPED